MAYLRRPVGSPCTRRDGPTLSTNAGTLRGFSLHAQGWPSTTYRTTFFVDVLPARAGMARPKRPLRGLPDCSPCTRRDGPLRRRPDRWGALFSLHAQGWPARLALGVANTEVLPARAGMAQDSFRKRMEEKRSPCTRRDGPIAYLPSIRVPMFSLHAQGWPSASEPHNLGTAVLPARAGMALFVASRKPRTVRSPCTRRDGPCQVTTGHRVHKFSLHAQGWPLASQPHNPAPSVLPARAGMARWDAVVRYGGLGSPCTRRDGPVSRSPRPHSSSFSLHAQGWPVRVVAGLPLSPFSLHAQGWPCVERNKNAL